MIGAPGTSGCVLVAPSSSALAALPGAERVRSPEDLATRLDSGRAVRTVVLGPDLDVPTVVDLLLLYRVSRPQVGFVLERRHVGGQDLVRAVDAGVRAVVTVGDLAGLAAAVARSDDGAGHDADEAPQENPPPATRTGGRVVTVYSAKGGVGTTTVATNLAAALAAGGRRSVVLVDLDLSGGDVAVGLGLSPAATLADAVGTAPPELDPRRLRAMLTAHSPGLSTLLAPTAGTVAGPVPPDAVRRVLRILRERVDHVVVDTPTTLDPAVLAALTASDEVVLVTSLDSASLRHTQTTLDTFERLEPPPGRWRVVLNRADAQVGLSVREAERVLGTSLDAQVPSSRDVPASLNRGVPLVLQLPGHPVSLAVRRFAERELLGPPAVVDLREDRPGGSVRGRSAGPSEARHGAGGRAGSPAPH